jgi:hypothetical protein
MDARKISRVMPMVIGIGFCLVSALKLWALSGAAAAPDPASGRTQAALFAPAVSTDWSYITPNQILVLGVATAIVLLLVVAGLGLMFYGRFFGDIDEEADIDAPAPPPSVKPVRKPRSFGIRAPRG